MSGDHNDPFIVIGAGSHAKVLISALLRQKRQILGLLDADAAKHGIDILGQPVKGGDEWLAKAGWEAAALINGIGSVGLPVVRQRVFDRLSGLGRAFASCIDGAAFVSPEAVLADGVQVMAGAVVQAGARLGRNVIVNSGAVIDHDCDIGDHCHIAPGAVLSGEVRVGPGSHIGTGATVIQSIVIGGGCLVAAGATLVRNLDDGERVAGVPARRFGDAG